MNIKFKLKTLIASLFYPLISIYNLRVIIINNIAFTLILII